MTCLPSDDPGRSRPRIRWIFGAWTRYPDEAGRFTTNAGCWADRSTFAFEDARDAAALFAGPHSPGGKLALVPGA